MLDSQHSVEKAIAGMDGLQVRDGKVLKAKQVTKVEDIQKLTKIFEIGENKAEK